MDDALDAVDNMHQNELNGRRLKVNLAKAKSGKNMLGTNRAVWEDQAWLKEHEIDIPDVCSSLLFTEAIQET